MERPIYYKLTSSQEWELYANRIGTREEIKQTAASLLESMKDDYPRARVHVGLPPKRRKRL